MADDVISREEAHVYMRRLRDKAMQWRKSQYRDGWRDAIESADQALNYCRTLETAPVVRCADCQHAGDRECTMIYCNIHRKHKRRDEYCNHGTPID